MSWWQYVQRVARTSRQRDITDVTGVDATEVTRWKRGKVPSPDKAAAFARGYKVPVLEAFVAANFLTADEAGVSPDAEPDFTLLTNDDLLELVRARMLEDVDMPREPDGEEGIESYYRDREERERPRRRAFGGESSADPGVSA